MQWGIINLQAVLYEFSAFGIVEKQEKIKEQFTKHADQYRNPLVHSNAEDLAFVHSIIAPEQHWKVLDIATGAGNLAVTLAPDVKEVVASDLTKAMLDQVEAHAAEKQLTNILTSEFDVHQIPLDDEEFDCVASRIAPHHFERIDGAVAEMARVLKPGGTFFIQDTLGLEDPEANEFFNTIEKLRDPSHVYDLPLSEWIKLLEKHRIRVLQVYKRIKFWPLSWWTNKMSTPTHDVKTIKELLEQNFDKFGAEMNYFKNEEEWEIRPFNGYIVGKKY